MSSSLRYSVPLYPQGFRLQSLRVNTTGIDAPTGDDIVKVLIAADTSEMLRIPTTQVRHAPQQRTSSTTTVGRLPARPTTMRTAPYGPSLPIVGHPPARATLSLPTHRCTWGGCRRSTPPPS